MLRLYLAASIIFVINLTIYCQRGVRIGSNYYDSAPAIGLVGGISGFQYSDLEIGIGYNMIESRPDNKSLFKTFLGVSLSAKMNPQNPEIIGQSFDLWFGSKVVLGLNQNFHTSGDIQNWGIKPYAGVDIFGIFATYGYNFILTEIEVPELSKHVFMIRYFLPLYRFK